MILTSTKVRSRDSVSEISFGGNHSRLELRLIEIYQNTIKLGKPNISVQNNLKSITKTLSSIPKLRIAENHA